MNIPACHHLFLAFLLLFVYACKQNPEINYENQVLFNNGWEFRIDSGDIHSPSDSVWVKVKLPHTPRIEPLIVNDQWQGLCEYRKTFFVSPDYKEKIIQIKFEGAMNVADVWCNGNHLKKHLGGFLPFVVDLTDHLQVGTENTIKVRLDNTDNPVTGPKPLEQLDFNTYGGLYRDVYLLVKNPLHITDPAGAGKVAGGGIFVTYPSVSEEEATIEVKTHVKNSGDTEKTFSLHQRLIRNSVEVATVETGKELIHPGEDKEVIVSLIIKNPLLWSPHTPDLYTLQTRLSDDGAVAEIINTRIGIRRIEIRKDEFRINGEEMFLRGVNRHQEYPYIGYALSNEAQYRDAFKIKQAGFDYVRLSHYPHDPAFMDACDELGLLVLDAIPGWQYFNEDIRFKEYVWQTCRDLIRRDRNHPCVLAWEVSLNESWMPEAFIDRAIAIAHEEYPGDHCYTAGWQYHGYDIYLQARQHRLQHYEKPDKPYIVSEYGDWEYYAMNAGLNQDAWADLMKEERSSRQLLSYGEKRMLQQVQNIQEAHNDNLSTPAFADGYWVMYDYNRGYADNLEASGIMSINRLPKFSYYFYSSQRDPGINSELYETGPMVFIASYWNERSTAQVKVFSNCEEVELALNDSIIGRQKPDDNRISTNLAHPPFTFHVDRFIPGKLEATGIIDGNAVTKHHVATPAKPGKISLSWDKSRKPATAGVKDVIFVYAHLLDDKNVLVPESNIMVTFDIAGDAFILNPDPVYTEGGIATAVIRIGESPGIIHVTAKVSGLETRELTVPVEEPSFLSTKAPW